MICHDNNVIPQSNESSVMKAVKSKQDLKLPLSFLEPNLLNRFPGSLVAEKRVDCN